MKIGRFLAATAVLIVSASAIGVTANAGPAHNRFAAELLDAHNAERDEIGAPRLQWSQRLAKDAQLWAARLAREGRMRHASQDERRGAGENLWTGSAGDYSATFMVRAFAEEKRHFRDGRFPDISRTGNWRDVGHYTQVVWSGTKEVGCAVARNNRDDFLVCRYWPAGNIYGQTVR